jgi:hypothetical protein
MTKALQGMQESKKKQTIDPFEVQTQLRRLRFNGTNINQKILAKRFHRSEMAISYAFQGKSRSLLRRIKRHLDKIYERKEAA